MTSRGGVSVLRTRWRHRRGFPSRRQQRAAARWSGESGGSLRFIGPQPHQRPPSPARNVRTREQKGGETLSSYSRLNHPGGGQSGPSHRCEPPHSMLGKCCVGAVWHDRSNGRYSFINREIQTITFKGESFILVFHLLVAVTFSTCQWGQVDQLTTKPAHPINC